MSADGYYSVKNFDKFQHYKDRNPPWIKLHRTLLADYEFSCLQDASKLLLMLFWLLASQQNNKIPGDFEWLKRQLPLNGEVDLTELIEKGFICKHDASTTIAKRSPRQRQRQRQNKTLRERKFTDADTDIARHILAALIADNPNLKRPDLDKWADTIRLMRERDNRKAEDIRKIFDWAHADDFWSANILSPDKLRKQYDTLVARMQRPANTNGKNKSEEYDGYSLPDDTYADLYGGEPKP